MLRYVMRSVTAVRTTTSSFLSSGLTRHSRFHFTGVGLILSVAIALVTSRPAFAQISQTDIGTFTTTTTQVTDIPNFTVSPGANVLVVSLSWRTPNSQNAANPPAVTYNGVPLTVAAFASDINANFSNTAVMYLFNPTSGANDLNVNYGVPLVVQTGGSDAAFNAFTLGGVDTNQAPDVIAGHNAAVANDGVDSLSNAFSNLTFGSWATTSANYRQGGSTTTQVLNATITTGTGGLVTNGSGGSTANGNLYDQVVDAQMIAGGALVSSIDSQNLTIQETGPGSLNHRFTLAGAVFAPLRGASSWNGGSATTNNWSDAANWGGTAPAAFNNLTFAGVNRTNAVNDIAAGTNYSSLTFDSTAASFTLSGNGIGLVGDLVNNSSNTQNVNLNVAVGFDINVNAASGNIAFGGSLSGTNAITLTGPNTVSLNAANTRSGAFNVNNGTLRVNHASGLQNSILSVNSPGTVQFAPSIGSFNLGGLSGNFDLSMTDANNQPLSFAIGGSSGSSVYDGYLSGGVKLTKVGSGTLTLRGTNSYSGATRSKAEHFVCGA